MDDERLPVLSHPMTHPMAACALPGGLSDEEVVLIAGIHRVRERAAELRRRLETVADADVQHRIEAELGHLRKERTRLVAGREQAWRDKMIRLGHLTPDDE